MRAEIQCLDPAGNLTAVVRTPVPADARLPLAKKVLAQGRAEQVAFETRPRQGGRSRIEMMGGEFCGNAVRSFGYLTAMEQYAAGVHTLLVEITGAEEPVTVTADLDRGLAFAEMPLPTGLSEVLVAGIAYPLVLCPGIVHLLVRDRDPDPAFVRQALAALAPTAPEAAGVLFLRGQAMTPAVYVRETDSLVWESSCGSGSVAWSWYLAREQGLDGERAYTLSQPGGRITAYVRAGNGQVCSCRIGGPVGVLPREWITL